MRLYELSRRLTDFAQVQSTYLGPLSSELVQSMQECNPEGPVMVQIAKLYHTTDAQSFRAFGRVISGTLRKGMDVKVLGESYSPEDEEDMVKAQVEDIWFSESRLVPRNLLIHLMSEGDTGTTFPQRRPQQGTLFFWVASTPRSPRPPPLLGSTSRTT